MAKISSRTVEHLATRFQLDAAFVMQCLEESVIEIRESNEDLDLGNGSALRLRRIERLCHTFNVDFAVASLLLQLTRRIAELEHEVRLLKK